jgi:hypothetical protein
VSLAKLLQSNRQLPRLLERLAQYSGTHRLPFRIVETNSIYDEGQPGVSDTLGSALWGLELMFEAAAAGAAGVNFHGGVHNHRASDDKAYTPIARSGDRYRATPLYYSMLMFAQAARGALVPAQLAPDTSGLKAFGHSCAGGNVTRLPDQPEHHGRRARGDQSGAQVYGSVQAAAGGTGHRCRRGDAWRRER